MSGCSAGWVSKRGTTRTTNSAPHLAHPVSNLRPSARARAAATRLHRAKHRHRSVLARPHSSKHPHCSSSHTDCSIEVINWIYTLLLVSGLPVVTALTIATARSRSCAEPEPDGSPHATPGCTLLPREQPQSAQQAPTTRSTSRLLVCQPLLVPRPQPAQEQRTRTPRRALEERIKHLRSPTTPSATPLPSAPAQPANRITHLIPEQHVTQLHPLDPHRPRKHVLLVVPVLRPLLR